MTLLAGAPAPGAATSGRPGRRFGGLPRHVIAVVLAATFAGVAGSMLQPAVTTVRAVVVVALVDDDDSAARALASQTAMLTGRAVLGPVSDRAGIASERLADTIEATAEPASGLLTLDVRDADPQRAQGLAAEIVDEYLRRAYVADVPADGIVRTRLLLPPHPVPDERPGPLAALGIGAGLGAVAAAAAALDGRRGRGRWG